MNADQVVEQLLDDPDFASCVTAYRLLPAREADYRDFPPSIDPRLVDSLRQRGIHRLYSHQAEAIDHALAGHNVAVVTPTASGKTLCYNVPVVSSIMHGPQRPRPLSVSDEGAVARPARRAAWAGRGARDRPQDLHL